MHSPLGLRGALFGRVTPTSAPVWHKLHTGPLCVLQCRYPRNTVCFLCTDICSGSLGTLVPCVCRCATGGRVGSITSGKRVCTGSVLILAAISALVCSYPFGEFDLLYIFPITIVKQKHFHRNARDNHRVPFNILRTCRRAVAATRAEARDLWNRSAHIFVFLDTVRYRPVVVHKLGTCFALTDQKCRRFLALRRWSCHTCGICGCACNHVSKTIEIFLEFSDCLLECNHIRF